MQIRIRDRREGERRAPATLILKIIGVTIAILVGLALAGILLAIGGLF